MRVPGAVAIAAVLIAAVLLLAACGSSARLSRSAYRSQLATIGNESDAAQQKVGRAFRATSIAQLAAALHTFATDEQRIGDQTAKLKPPKDADAANRELADGLHDTASELTALLPKIQKMPNAKTAIAYLQHAPQTKGGREIDDALATLKRLGYVKKIS